MLPVTSWSNTPIKGTSGTELSKTIPFHQGSHCLMEEEFFKNLVVPKPEVIFSILDQEVTAW